MKSIAHCTRWIEEYKQKAQVLELHKTCAFFILSRIKGLTLSEG